MKYLIVNGDDFGASRGINRAIIELHERGVLTSTSLMIRMPAASEAVELANGAPRLGVGLHVTLTDEDCNPLVEFDDAAACIREIEGQIRAFGEKLGRLPTHIDTHQNVHRDERLTSIFRGLTGRYAVPLREHSPVRYLSEFHGRCGGVSHPEQLSVDNLIRMLDREVLDGITELSCHPGYVGPDFFSPYDAEREIEVRTLSDPRFAEFLQARGIGLINFGELGALAA
jgi:predicted glycoside hydrolase/deacetylase ChbG (UPF0249 family)